MRSVALVTLGLLLAACSARESTGAGGHAGAGGEGPIVIGDRQTEVHVPPGYSPKSPAPLVIMLHGYSASGLLEDLYLDLVPLSTKYGFLYAYPDSSIDQQGKMFWNATEACCNFDGSTVDDSGYLSALITAIEARYSVDPKRVYLIGHSNGGYMAYRAACDHADQIAAIASLAGAMWQDPSKCQPTAPVSVLEIHGTADQSVLYAGSPGAAPPIGGAYPSADTTVKDWAALDGCSLTPDTSSPPLDIDLGIPGDETTVQKFEQGCAAGTAVELWSIQGGMHLPAIGSTFREGVIQFLLAHPKP